MAVRYVANDIADVLETEGIGTVGTNIFRGPLRPFTQLSSTDVIPRNALFVSLPIPGPDPVPMAGSAYEMIRIASVQIIVRNTDTSSNKAQQTYDVLASLTPDNYIALEMIGSGPAYIPGIDANRGNLWTINLHAIYDQRESKSYYGTGVYGTATYS